MTKLRMTDRYYWIVLKAVIWVVLKMIREPESDWFDSESRENLIILKEALEKDVRFD